MDFYQKLIRISLISSSFLSHALASSDSSTVEIFFGNIQQLNRPDKAEPNVLMPMSKDKVQVHHSKNIPKKSEKAVKPSSLNRKQNEYQPSQKNIKQSQEVMAVSTQDKVSKNNIQLKENDTLKLLKEGDGIHPVIKEINEEDSKASINQIENKIIEEEVERIQKNPQDELQLDKIQQKNKAKNEEKHDSNKVPSPAPTIDSTAKETHSSLPVNKDQDKLPNTTVHSELLSSTPITRNNEDNNIGQFANSDPDALLEVTDSLDNQPQNTELNRVNDVEILPDPATPTVNLETELSFEDKLKNMDNETGNKTVTEVAKKNWKDYIPFIKKKKDVVLEESNLPINSSYGSQNLPPLPTIVDNKQEELQVSEQSLASVGRVERSAYLKYDLNQIELNEFNRTRVNKMMTQAKLGKAQIKVVGYSIDQDTDSRRIALQRVINLRQYLANNGFDAERIVVQVLPANVSKGQSSNIIDFSIN